MTETAPQPAAPPSRAADIETARGEPGALDSGGMRLLRRLNENNAPAFSRYLAGLAWEPNICWYPSAGEDFRDLLYLSRSYAAHDLAAGPEADPPDLFLHTDYYPWTQSSFLDHRYVRGDGRTRITIEDIEELGRLDLPRHADLVRFPKPNGATGRVVYLRLSINSDVLGQLPDAHVLYAFVENTAFCAEILIPHRARISHLVHVRYGGGCGGGGSASGAWLNGVIGRLGCQTLITDGSIGHWQDRDRAAVKLYPVLSGPEEPPTGRLIRTVPSVSWSGHGDVSWIRIDAHTRDRAS